MINLIDSLSTALLNNTSTDVIYFDFAKAFDSVNHDLILKKLKHIYGIDGRMLKFLRGYLQDRKQRVVLDNHISEEVKVLSGVPQGSILGPLLFVLFINDIYTNIDPNTNIELYADDTKMRRRINSIHDCEFLQNDIKSLYKWAIDNKMKFHPGKCKVLTISKEKEQAFQTELPFMKTLYALGSVIMDSVDSEKDLGAAVNTKLDWTEHQSCVLNKAHKMLGLTKRTCYFITDYHRRRQLYLILVRSNFEHCSIVWRPYYNSDISKFEALQKKAVNWNKMKLLLITHMKLIFLNVMSWIFFP